MLFGTEYTAEKAFDHLDEDKDGEVDYFFLILNMYLKSLVLGFNVLELNDIFGFLKEKKIVS